MGLCTFSKVNALTNSRPNSPSCPIGWSEYATHGRSKNPIIITNGWSCRAYVRYVVFRFVEWCSLRFIRSSKRQSNSNSCSHQAACLWIFDRFGARHVLQTRRGLSVLLLPILPYHEEALVIERGMSTLRGQPAWPPGLERPPTYLLAMASSLLAIASSLLYY